MVKRLLPILLMTQVLAPGAIVDDVRAAIAQNNFAKADSLIAEYRKANGVQPEMIAALSWMGRGALAAKRLNEADAYAQQTQTLAVAQLKHVKLDSDKFLPAALGAAIEVQAQVFAQRGERSSAVAFLNKQLSVYHDTSIRARIQKNIHMLSLEGKAAPPLEGVKLPVGKPVLLFFWAHWCGDCKAMGPTLARIKKVYVPKGLVIIAPTQRYGYVARGEDAAPAVETQYIQEVRKRYYPDLLDVLAPINEENMRRYGASTTPTLVLIDAKGIVRMYHPDDLSYDELESRIKQLVP
jgi:thiol-disulfide isomerase/thioredoxin